MGFYVMDIETLATNETAVVLSLGAIYIDASQMRQQRFDLLATHSLFIKFNAREQGSLGRSISKSTLEWWGKQSNESRLKSFYPSKDDVSVRDGIVALHKFVIDHSKFSKDVPCYTRGTFDQMITQHLAASIDMKLPWEYNQFRDVRTYIDVVYPKSERGYIAVNLDLCPDYNRETGIAHDPVYDCMRDAAMMLFGELTE